ncbi:hypothetical protein ANTPLA_LOCUS7778 [Anthophora plagiata]
MARTYTTWVDIELVYGKAHLVSGLTEISHECSGSQTVLNIGWFREQTSGHRHRSDTSALKHSFPCYAKVSTPESPSFPVLHGLPYHWKSLQPVVQRRFIVNDAQRAPLLECKVRVSLILQEARESKGKHGWVREVLRALRGIEAHRRVKVVPANFIAK